VHFMDIGTAIEIRQCKALTGQSAEFSALSP
jgi:hypothetical protein